MTLHTMFAAKAVKPADKPVVAINQEWEPVADFSNPFTAFVTAKNTLETNLKKSGLITTNEILKPTEIDAKEIDSPTHPGVIKSVAAWTPLSWAAPSMKFNGPYARRIYFLICNMFNKTSTKLDFKNAYYINALEKIYRMYGKLYNGSTSQCIDTLFKTLFGSKCSELDEDKFQKCKKRFCAYFKVSDEQLATLNPVKPATTQATAANAGAAAAVEAPKKPTAP